MKNVLKLCLPVLCFILISCDKEENLVQEAGIANIIFLDKQVQGESQDLEVTIQKPTPCHTIKETILIIKENSIDYNFIMDNDDEVCATVLTNETVTVKFDPSTPGEYLLNFFINGVFHQTITVTVTGE